MKLWLCRGLKNHDVRAYADLSQEKKEAIADEEQKIGMLKKDCPQD